MTPTIKTLPRVGIVNANKLTIGQSAYAGPSMRMAMNGLFRTMNLSKVVKKTINFETVEVLVQLVGSGVVQPLQAQELEIKPEGQRAWTWKKIHCTPDLVLIPDDVIVYLGVQYRVMGKWDYLEYGYVKYEVVTGYQRGS